MTIEGAIAQLDSEIESLGSPKEDSTNWWTVRAKSHGASLLRVIQAKGLTDTVTAEAFRKSARKQMQSSNLDIGILTSDVADSVADRASGSPSMSAIAEKILNGN